MVAYQISHKTEYQYQEPIGLCQNIARLTPRSFTGQTCLHSEIVVDPIPDVFTRYEDFFGNLVAYYAIEQEHNKLSVLVNSRVQIKKKQLTWQMLPRLSWEHAISTLHSDAANHADILQYVPPTAMTMVSEGIKQYTLQSFLPNRPLVECVYELMERIFTDFEFKPGLTTVATPVDTVLHLKKGVCQDFAHLAISCIRSMGLPVRYMSGYIETIQKAGTEKLVGADASHAWFSVFVPEHGWVDFDPTNNQMPTYQHITVAWGRDYADIAPLKGVIQSSRPHKLSVAVTVERIAG
jgi:transglutaminase-like putative cysteine protease